MSESRTAKDMFDRRLRFSNISESDGGEYQCSANNSQGRVTHTYTLIVEGTRAAAEMISLTMPQRREFTARVCIICPVASPYWIKEPVSQLYAPGETVRLDCQADGIPSPTISWTINGILLSGQQTPALVYFITQPLPHIVYFLLTDIDEDSRPTLTAGGSLILSDVSSGDTAIYQCQASNKHGNILSNTHVYVVGESALFTHRPCESACDPFSLSVVSELPPQILTEDGNTYTFTEGQKALLECETFGSPKPKVTW